MRPDRPAAPPESEAGTLSASSIQRAAQQAGLDPLTDTQAEQFSLYGTLLQRWNSHLNLTALRSPQQILERHFIECIYCAQHLIGEPTTLLDYGSGAGFPGIPVAICRPNTSITLAESKTKKASFLLETVRTLGLSAKVFSGRVEAMPPDLAYDAVTLRAVDKMEVALPEAINRVKPGGHLVLMTTAQADWSHALSGLLPASSQPLPNSTDRILSQFQRP